MPPRKQAAHLKKANKLSVAARSSSSTENNDDGDDNNENESLNEEESSIINNQTTNLPISAASAADLLQSQEMQFPDTHDDMDTSHNDPNEANTNNNDLTNEQPNLLVPPILVNQNLSISAAPAADLLQSQEIQTPGTPDDMDNSQNDINDSNTINNDLSNQQPNLLVLPKMPNQNLSLSAASAAALSLPQDIQSSATNDAMCTSQNNIYDANYDLFNQRQNLLLLSNSNTVNVLGMAPQTPQLGF
jgi:hypothetical protein